MNKKQKKTLLKTMGGITASSILISSVVLQPTGNIKQAVNKYEQSQAAAKIQTSALEEAGVIGSPHLAKALSSPIDETDPVNRTPFSDPLMIPDYVSSSHMEEAIDSDGDDVDMITQEQTVSRDITLSNGDKYKEVHGWQDDLGNYLDELPANAVVGEVNTPAVGLGTGYQYTEYTHSTSRQWTTFSSKVSSTAVHNVYNTAPTGGPARIYDDSTGTFKTVATSGTGQVGDGTGGLWRHSKTYAGSSWPRVGFNPSLGNWGYSSIMAYSGWLFDWHVGSSGYWYTSYNAWNWMNHNGWGTSYGNGNRTVSRSEFLQMVARAWSLTHLPVFFWSFAFNLQSGYNGNSPTMNSNKDYYGQLYLHHHNFYNMFGGTYGGGDISWISNGNQSWEVYSGNREDEWQYYGYEYTSTSPTSGSGTSQTVYGRTTNYWTNTSGDMIWDQDKKVYETLPKNAEKEAVIGAWNYTPTSTREGVGDESGNYYYQGTLNAYTNQPMNSLFNPDSSPDFTPGEHDAQQVGDGSGRTYERALYYYDGAGTRIHDLPTDEFRYTDTSGELFSSGARDTYLETTGAYEGVGIGATLQWLSENTDSFDIEDDFNRNGLGVEWVVTETDTKQRKLLIAIQAAVDFMTGANSQTAFDAALAKFAQVVTISTADQNAISSVVSSTSISSITTAVTEGYREDIQFFGKTFNIFGTSTTTTAVANFLDSDDVADFFAVSTDIGTMRVEKSSGTEYVYYDITGDTLAEQQLSLVNISHVMDTTDAYHPYDLWDKFSIDDWGLAVDNRAVISDVRYTDFDYDKTQMTVEAVVHIGDKVKFFREVVTFDNSYMDQIMRELAIDEFVASQAMLAEQPLLTSAEYSHGSQGEVDGDIVSFALPDAFLAKFPEDVSIVDVVQLTPPTEEQTSVEFEFTINYEGHERTYSQFFDFAKTRSQKYVEDAVASITSVTSTVSIYDKTILDLTSRAETFQPFEDFLVADGNTAARMSFANIQLVGGGDIDRDATSIDFIVDITMGGYTLAGHQLTLNLNHSVNQELINNLTQDEIVATSPGIVAIVDDFDPLNPEYQDSAWWTIQSSWLQMIDVAGIAFVGNFRKVDERHFEVDLEVTIGSVRKTITVNQKVGFNLNFAPVLDESTTGISDPDTLAAFREYMLRFDEQSSVFYIGNFAHAFIATAALESELLQAWQGSVATLAGDAVIRSVSITDINAVTKYDREVSFRITLEDSLGNTRTFDKTYQFAISPVAFQFRDATAAMINTTQNLAGQLSDSVMAQMQNISDYQWLDEHLNLLDTIRVVSVTNTGKTAHLVFELGYSGHLGFETKQVTIDYIFDRRADKDLALSMFGLGYTESDLSAYYDINDVDAAGNDWKNVEQLVLDELVKFAAQSTLRDDMEDEMKATHTSINSNVWASNVELQTAIEDITTTAIMEILQAEILAGGITRTTFITNEWTVIRNDKMEEMILSDLASNWKLNSATDALNEVLKYNNVFNIQDFYLTDVITIVENANFDTDVALEIAHDTLLPQVMNAAQHGVSSSTDPEYFAAIEQAVNDAFVAEYGNNHSGTWTNINEFISLISDSTSQIIITAQVNAAAGTIGSTTHYDDRTINDLIKDLSIFTDEQIKIVGFDVENGAALDRDSNSFGIEIFMTFGSIVNQRHVFTLDLDKSVNQAILDQIQSSDIDIKDFLVKELADELELEHYSTWDKFGLSSVHVLPEDNIQATVDASSFAIVGDATTSPRFTLDFTFTIGTTSITINSELRIGMEVIFDLKDVDPADTVLLEYLRGYDVAERVDYHGTWIHPFAVIEALDADESAVDDVLTLYSGLVASGVQINEIYVHNRNAISEFARTLTLKIVAQDKNGFVKVFDKVITFQMTTAEWAFSQFTESSITLADQDLTNGMLTDGVKAGILGQKSGYVITDQMNPIQVDDPVVSHNGKTATVVWRVWYTDGQAGGASNSKTIEIDYVFASRGSKDEALANYGLEYADDASGINVDWTNVDGTNDWTNVEQNVLDELVRSLAETQIRTDLEDSILADASEYASYVWSSLSLMQADIVSLTDVDTISDLAANIVAGSTTRLDFMSHLKLNMQRDKIEENILTTMQARWNMSSVENLLNLIAQLNSIIDVKTYYEADMHTVIQTSTYALDIARQMELDTIRNNVSGIITAGLNPSDQRYTIYNDVMNAKLDDTYDVEQAKPFTDVTSLIRTIADSISQEAIDDLLASINSEINGTVDLNTRVLEDIYRDLGAFDQAGILHSSIAIAGGGQLDYDSNAIPLTVDLIWGSVTNNSTSITMNLNQTISYAMIEAIDYDAIGLIDPRLAPTADQVDVNALTSDLFSVFSRHILGSDTYTLTIDSSTFTTDPIEPRDFYMDVTIVIGAETRVINILASVGFDIDLDWNNIDWDTATDAEKDMINFMNSYDFQNETEFTGLHANPWELRDELHLMNWFNPSRNLVAARGTFESVVIKDPSSITKYDRSLWITVTVSDKNGVTYQYDKEIILGLSYMESLTLIVDQTYFDILPVIDLTEMLTDDVVTEMGLLSSYDLDALLPEFDLIEVLTLLQSGKTATATFRISYDNGQGHSGSKIVTKDFTFVSRGSKDDAVAEFGLGYSDGALGIDWNLVDSFGNDWTNVEQDVLGQLVQTTAFEKVRFDTRVNLTLNSTGYVDNVFGSIGELDAAILDFASHAELTQLQDLITNNIKTRGEWVSETTLFLQTSNVERMILEALGSEWRLSGPEAALIKAESLSSGFDIASYYSDIDNLVLNASFDTDQARQIGYDVFWSITRDHMDVFNSTVDTNRDIHYDTIHASLFEAKYDENITETWAQLTDFGKLISDRISRQYIDDEIAKLTVSSTGYPTIDGIVDFNTRGLNDVMKDFSLLERSFIDVSNIRLTSNGTVLNGDLIREHILAGISFGSVVVDDITFTLELNQTVNFAIMEAITADDIRMTEYRLAGLATDVDPDDILAWMFTALAPHLRDSDSVVVSLDQTNPFTPEDIATDPYARRYTIGITLTLGNETRDYLVNERMGQMIVFGDIDSSRWLELGIIDAADEVDFIDYNDNYPYVDSITYSENFDHVLDVQSATERDWNDALTPSLYVLGGGLTIAQIELKDAGSYTKYDKEFTFILTLEDSWGDQQVFEKTIRLANSAVEYALIQTTEAGFSFTHHDPTTAILTDDTLANILTNKSSYLIDSYAAQYLDISDPIVQYSGKTATIGFELSFDNGAGYSDSKVIQIEIVFASRGSKDEAITNFGLGYDDARLGINWNSVDSLANDWTNVEQEVLDNLVKTASQFEVRADINDAIIASAVEYISNVWESQHELALDVEAETTYALLLDLQAEITSGNITRAQFVIELAELLKTRKIESLLFGNIASLWRLNDNASAESRAVSIKSDFDIKDYYFSNMDGIIQSASFVDTITYNTFEAVYRTDIDVLMLLSANDADKPKVTEAINNFINDKVREVFALNIWTNDSTIISHASHLISAQAIDDAMNNVGSTVLGTVSRDTRNIKDVSIDWAPLQYEGLYVSNILLNGSVDGEFVDRDTTTLPSSISITFGTIIDQSYLLDVEINQTVNQAILGALTSSSLTLTNAKYYANVDHMLTQMNETDTITNARYFESSVDFLTRDDAEIAVDPANPLSRDADSARRFSIGLIITAGAETLHLEINVQVGESIDFSLPEFSVGGTFDFSPYFVTTTDTYNNPYDLYLLGDGASSHIGIDEYLLASYVEITSILITGNAGMDIFSRTFVATFTLRDQGGNTRTFVDQSINIPGSMNKAEAIMDSVDQSQITLSNSSILTGQLTDEMLHETLHSFNTYSFGNDIDLLNTLQIKEVTHLGKTATVTFIVGYNDNAGTEDFVEYTYDYIFAYRADVPYALNYYGLDMTVDQLGIRWTEDQRTGNVEQTVIDGIVIQALRDYLFTEFLGELNSFIDAGIFTQQELEDDITAFLSISKIEDIAADGQTMLRNEVIAKYKSEIVVQTVTKGLDTIAVTLLKANNWLEVATAYPRVTSGVESSVESAIQNGTFDARNIESMLVVEFAIAISPDVEAIAENGTPGLDGWLGAIIGSAKPGFLWRIHLSIEEQLSAGFDDAPILSQDVSGIHVNENSANGWFLDEISHLTSFANMDDYIIHLSTKLARMEIPAQISDEQLFEARVSLRTNIINELQDIIDDGTITVADIDSYLDVLLYVDNDHPQGWPEANFDAVFTPEKYFLDNKDAIIIEQLTHTGTERAKDTGFDTIEAFLAATATFIEVDGDSLKISTNNANYTSSVTMDEMRDLQTHYLAMLKNNIYVDAFDVYQDIATGSNIISRLTNFMNAYISKMDAYLSLLEGIEYDNQDNLDGQINFIAMRVNQIQNKPDIQAIITDMIINIGLSDHEDDLDDTPYRDLKKFTITFEELFDHLYSQALAQILTPGGTFDLVVDGLTNPPTPNQIANARLLLDDLMQQQYPRTEKELDITIKSALLFATLDDEYYERIIAKYDELVENQTPMWTPQATIPEAQAQMDPIIELIFEQLINETIDFDGALTIIDYSVEDIAILLTWTKYEEAFMGIFQQLQSADANLERMTIEELEEYATTKLLKPSLSYYIQEFMDSDQEAMHIPNTLDMLDHLQGIIDGAIDYAQELFDDLLSEIAETSRTDIQTVIDNSSIMDAAILLEYQGHSSTGGTTTEIKALRALLGKYVFELIIEVTEKPDPEQSLNGWLIPFAAMITKTEDYSQISKIIQDKIDMAEEIDYDNWGFEDIADIMDALIDTTNAQETYNSATGKILMDKFVKGENTTNAWSTTMWMGPVPLRMTYGSDGDISRMQTILMDREDPETISSIGLSTHYNQNEFTLRLGMTDGTIVYVRYVQDADGNINVILQRLDKNGNWLTSEMYREQNVNEEITWKNYQIFRDSNLGQFKGIESEFEEGIITIFGKSPIPDPFMDINDSTVKSTIEHVWGENPTVDNSTDTGNASSARALVTKDDEGKTHIQMNGKDIRITNDTNSITAVITAGGFTLMWLIWTFLAGFGALAGATSGYFLIGVRRKERKLMFVRKNPQFAGASVKTLLKLRSTMKKRNKAQKIYDKTIALNSTDFDARSKEKELLTTLQYWNRKTDGLEAVAYAEAEATRFRKTFAKGVSKTALLSENSIDRAAELPLILRQRTRIANRYAGGKFVVNEVQDNMVIKNDRPVRKALNTKTPTLVEEERNFDAVQDNGPTLREIERTIVSMQYLKTTLVIPEANSPKKGVDFSPLTNLGIKIRSATFKRANIDKNVNTQTLALILIAHGREFYKDIKVQYQRSINENIIMNINDYELDITLLRRFELTTDPGFDHDGICNLFKVRAPGAITQLVKGSLVIKNTKEYSGQLRITIGKLSAVIPFKAKL